jgi:transposase-like protein
MRWPDGVTCPHCSSDSVIKDGRDDTQPDRQRYECRGCRQRFDDLTDTIFAGHHQPLRTWIACLYLMGLNLSGLQTAPELDINGCDRAGAKDFGGNRPIFGPRGPSVPLTTVRRA